jgi:hypothetical protein
VNVLYIVWVITNILDERAVSVLIFSALKMDEQHW